MSGTIHIVCSLPGHCLDDSQRAGGQEVCVVEGKSEGVLVGLFTGHGKEGKYAAQLCRETCLTGFLQSKGQNNPETFLESVISDCDRRLKATEQVAKSPYSGS